VSTLARSSLPMVTLSSARPDAAGLLDVAHKTMGMIPNMYGHMAQVPALLSAYAHGYEQFRTASGFTPAEQEVVLLAISRENACTYCVAAHSTLADGPSRVPVAVTNAIRDDAPVPDARLGALAAFTRTMVSSRGRPTQDQVHAFHRAGFSDRDVFAIILAIGVKTLSNYSNHFTDPELDAPFVPRAWTDRRDLRDAPAAA
jgi:uncharacterized peroxidase-related enzyme